MDEFERYSKRIVKIRKNKRDLGFAMRSYFKDKRGRKLILESNLITMEKIKTKEIYIELHKGLFGLLRQFSYSQKFIDEISKKVGTFKEIKEININI